MQPTGPGGADAEHLDVLVVGAGLSGIGAACRLRAAHPGRSLAVLETREASGGTWDLFRYPGVRSDSDLYTFGYSWRPWLGDRGLVDGPSILRYLRETAVEHGVDRLIRYRHKATRASWDSESDRWTVEVDAAGERRTITTDFLYCCTGYYDYEQGYAPAFPGQGEYAGRMVHPQHWPDDLDYTGKRVVVIGSGATAVTLVPAMAERAGHVTMLQRSPSYVLSLPGRDPVARALRRLPPRMSYPVVRWSNVLKSVGAYTLSRRRPALARRLARAATRRALPPHVDVDVHFKPAYDPWDQRMCFVPDGDLFETLADGSASIVTDTIDRFTERGILLSSGEHLDADVIVTATGLNVLLFGGMTLVVDGKPVVPRETMTYRSMMLSGVPNLVYTIGYTNASWTLKADLVAEYVCRLLAELDRRGVRRVVPVRDPAVESRPFIDLTSGYVQRMIDEAPRQGDREPWRLRQNYLRDLRTIRRGPLDDGVLRFG